MMKNENKQNRNMYADNTWNVNLAEIFKISINSLKWQLG